MPVLLHKNILTTEFRIYFKELFHYVLVSQKIHRRNLLLAYREVYFHFLVQTLF